MCDCLDAANNFTLEDVFILVMTVVLLYATISMARSGEASLLWDNAKRSDNPWKFWLMVIVTGLGAVLCGALLLELVSGSDWPFPP